MSLAPQTSFDSLCDLDDTTFGTEQADDLMLEFRDIQALANSTLKISKIYFYHAGTTKCC